MSKDTLQDFALKHKCSMLDTDRLIRELIEELEEIKDRLKKLEGDSDKTVGNTDAAEPLIKDEKIRKAVRAWAEANDITHVSYDAGWNAFRCTDFVVNFDYDFDRHDGLKDMKSYTITELCGEEEE